VKIQTNVTPPPRANKYRRYAVLVEALRINDGWVAVSTDDIGRRSIAEKQSAVHGTCRRAGLKIETRTTATQIFVRKLREGEVQDAA
jgi:hypothetical protein